MKAVKKILMEGMECKRVRKVTDKTKDNEQTYYQTMFSNGSSVMTVRSPFPVEGVIEGDVYTFTADASLEATTLDVGKATGLA